MSTDKLRTLLEKIKRTDFEKEVINNIPGVSSRFTDFN